jgi:hypothetical protein
LENGIIPQEAEDGVAAAEEGDEDEDDTMNVDE